MKDYFFLWKQKMRNRFLHSLKSDCTRIYYFGLGFIQIVVDEATRYHFYDYRSLQTPGEVFVESPHNHRYDFSSVLIEGRLNQRIYSINEIDGSGYLLSEESCNEQNKSKALGEYEVGISEIFSTTLQSRDKYFINHATFHTVEADIPTVTKLVRSEYKKELADVLRPKNMPKVCPFAEKYEEDYLWEVVEKIIVDYGIS
jgi:hypothetical protein